MRSIRKRWYKITGKHRRTLSVLLAVEKGRSGMFKKYSEIANAELSAIREELMLRRGKDEG